MENTESESEVLGLGLVLYRFLVRVIFFSYF